MGMYFRSLSVLYITMTSHQPFERGDRVCVIFPRYNLPLGTRGTILRTLLQGSDIYDVHFDTVRKPELIVGEWLCLEAEWDATLLAISEEHPHSSR